MHLLYFFEFNVGKFLYIIIPIKIYIISAVKRKFSYYIIIKEINLLIIRIGIIQKYNIITINNKSSQKKMVVIIIRKY